jgi:hypothetical protein
VSDTLILFERRFRDSVVEYYFLPERRDIRLTVRFGDVLVHRELLVSGNYSWEAEPERFASLVKAEDYALGILVGHTTSHRKDVRKISTIRESAIAYVPLGVTLTSRWRVCP